MISLSIAVALSQQAVPGTPPGTSSTIYHKRPMLSRGAERSCAPRQARTHARQPRRPPRPVSEKLTPVRPQQRPVPIIACAQAGRRSAGASTTTNRAEEHRTARTARAARAPPPDRASRDAADQVEHRGAVELGPAGSASKCRARAGRPRPGSEKPAAGDQQGRRRGRAGRAEWPDLAEQHMPRACSDNTNSSKQRPAQDSKGLRAAEPTGRRSAAPRTDRRRTRALPAPRPAPTQDSTMVERPERASAAPRTVLNDDDPAEDAESVRRELMPAPLNAQVLRQGPADPGRGDSSGRAAAASRGGRRRTPTCSPLTSATKTPRQHPTPARTSLTLGVPCEDQVQQQEAQRDLAPGDGR